MAAFIEYKSSLEAAQPDQNLPAHVLVQNLSNMPVSFQLTWSSPEDSVTFEPVEPQQVKVPSGETAKVEYTAQPASRPLLGGERSFPYTVNVQTSGGQAQTLESTLVSKGLDTYMGHNCRWSSAFVTLPVYWRTGSYPWNEQGHT